MAKVIITAAITGASHSPTMSPYLPITPQQIIDEAVRSHEAGAAVAHIHVRNPENGLPTNDVELFREVLSGIKARSNVVVCMSTGGGVNATAEQRIASVKELKPELASLNCGSMNFALPPSMVGRLDKINFKQPWEKLLIQATDSSIFANTFDTLKHFLTVMNETDTLPEVEMYDVGMINNCALLIEQEYFTRPLYIQYVMGILGGIPATVDHLLYLYNTARKEIGEFKWSVCAAGRHQFPMGVTNMILGGHMRVGLEDSLFLEKGKLARSNAEQVEKAVRIARELGRDPATPEETRGLLGLKGLDKVNY